MDPETENPQVSPEDPEKEPENTQDPDPEVTGDDPERSQPDEPNPNEEEDPFEVAYRARRALEEERDREAALAEAREQLLREQEQARSTERSAEEQRRLNESFTETIKRVRDGLRTIKVRTQDDEIIEANLSDEMLEQLVIQPFQAHNSVVSQAEQTRILGLMGTSAVESLPETSREDFAKKASGKPLPEWLKAYAETAAANTEYVRNLQKEIDVKIKAAEARGFARGQKAPGSTPHQTAERPANSSAEPNLTTPTGLIAAQREGKISEEEFRTRWAAL